jgi:PII-like signaling protein
MNMESGSQAVLLRIFIGESDHWHGKPLHSAIVQAARERGLAGATVLRGIEGFGAKSVIHTTRLLDLSTDLPIVVEIVDGEERVMEFLETAKAMVQDGLATLERVNVVFYRDRGDGPPN